ncbi:MAG: helical backbone metal receptor, partial [Ginsengibacter sp.]
MKQYCGSFLFYKYLAAIMIIELRNISNFHTYSRIISLVPSITELLYDLGMDIEVTGITKFCVHPTKWYKNKTRVGGTKNINIKTIQLLQPDLIIANKEENVKKQVEELAKLYDVLVTDPNDLPGALQMIKDIGMLTGKINEASDLVNKIETGFQKLKRNFYSKRKFKAAYLIWQNPYMT